MQLVKITNTCAIFYIDGAIVSVDVEPSARAILKYYNKQPANDI